MIIYTDEEIKSIIIDYKKHISSGVFSEFIKSIVNMTYSSSNNLRKPFFNVKDIIYRIKNDIITDPKCLHCSAPVKFIGIGYRTFCSVGCKSKFYGNVHKGTDINFVKKDKSITLSDITKDMLTNNIDINGNISTNFFKKLTFNFTSEEAYLIYNDIQEKPRCTICNCDVSFRNFKKGYSKFCSTTCSRKSEDVNSRIKRTALVVDKDGINSYQRGVLNKLHIDIAEGEYGVDGYLNALYRARDIETDIERMDKELYRSIVNKYTRLQPLHLLTNIDKRGVYSSNNDAYHLDHIYSVSAGFKNNVPPRIIGSFVNLQMIPALENTAVKNSKSYISLDELYEKYFKYVEENN